MLTDDERTRVLAPLEAAWTLPPRAYTDPSVWEVEVERIFRREWVCVARVDQLPSAGSQLAVEVAGQPIVVTRDIDGPDGPGEIRALANVCLHRAMPLVEGEATGRFLTCPYHLWSYRLDGRLATAPHMDASTGFEPGEQCLPRVALEIWEGFVFVSLAAEPEPLGPALEPLRTALAGYDLADLVVADSLDFDSPWNWKLLVENFMEAYHHLGPHRQSFQPVYPAALSTVDDNGGGPWALLRMPGIRGDEEGPGRDGLPFLPGLATDERDQLLAACVFPTLLLATSGNLVVWYQLSPEGHDRMTLRIHLLLERAQLDRPEVIDVIPAYMGSIRAVHEEDIEVNEGPWRGLHAPLTTQGRLAPLEAAIWQLNQLWLDRVEPGP